MIPCNNKRWNIVELSDVDSTNSWIHDKFSGAVIQSGTVARSAFQSAGRGQRGNSWQSEPGANLLFSFLHQPKAFHATNQFLLSQAVSLAVVQWLLPYTPLACIKWPNDIYVGEKKIAGILIENILVGHLVDASIIGIGININQTDFSSDLPNPTSLALLTNWHYDVAEELVKLLNCMDNSLQVLEEKKYETLTFDYTQHLLRYQKPGLFMANCETFSAQIIEVKPWGEIVLQLEDGSLREYGFKEVRHVFESTKNTSIIV